MAPGPLRGRQRSTAAPELVLLTTSWAALRPVIGGATVSASAGAPSPTGFALDWSSCLPAAAEEALLLQLDSAPRLLLSQQPQLAARAAAQAPADGSASPVPAPVVGAGPLAAVIGQVGRDVAGVPTSSLARQTSTNKSTSMVGVTPVASSFVSEGRPVVWGAALAGGTGPIAPTAGALTSFLPAEGARSGPSRSPLGLGRQENGRLAGPLGSLDWWHAAGVVVAALSALCNTAFATFIRPAAGKSLDPAVFNVLVVLGVFLSSLSVPPLAGAPLVWTKAGALGGVLFACAAALAASAVRYTGLATAQSVWRCAALVTSFLWGAFGPLEVAAPMKSWLMGSAGVFLILCGFLLLACSEEGAQGSFCSIANKAALEAAANGSQGLLGAAAKGEACADAGARVRTSVADRIIGVVLAITVGALSGCVLVPLKLAPISCLAAVPSFGVGAFVTGLVIAIVQVPELRSQPGQLRFRPSSAVAGVASGVLWTIGLVCSIVAQEPPFSVAFGVAYPILQCSVVFACVMGTAPPRETEGSAAALWTQGAVLLATGVLTLIAFGPGS